VAVAVLVAVWRAAAPAPEPRPSAPTSPGGALAVLAGIPVAPDGTLAGYSRAQFHLWGDPDRNGCDARNDTLRRDLTAPAAKDGTRGCVIVAGALHDPYTGRTVAFAKASADQVPIDHVVPLAAAWRHGAAGWDDGKRARFGNDPAELQATTVEANTAKSDRGPASWLPPNPDYLCVYATRYTTILAAWGLSVSPQDRDALARVLAGC